MTIGKLKNDNDALSNQVGNLQLELQQAHQSLNEKEIIAKDLTLSYLQSDANSQTVQNGQIGLETRSQIDELSELRKKCDDLRYQNTNLSDWNMQLEENIKYYETLPPQIEQLQLQLNQSEVDHQNELSQLKLVIEDKSNELDKFASRYTEVECKYDFILDNFQNEVDSLKNQIQNMKIELNQGYQSSKDNDIQLLRQKIEAKDETFVELQSKFDNATEQLELAARTHSDDISVRQKEFDDLRNQNTNLGDWNAQLEENVKYYETLPPQIEQLQLQMNQSEADHQNELSQLNATIADKSNELDTHSFSYTEIQSKLWPYHR